MCFFNGPGKRPVCRVHDPVVVASPLLIGDAVDLFVRQRLALGVGFYLAVRDIHPMRSFRVEAIA